MPMSVAAALNDIRHGLVLRPSYVPEELGFNQKGVNQKLYSYEK
jgi:hypothetical protein